jgi:ribosomal protein L16 Arg81 hydroxylase
VPDGAEPLLDVELEAGDALYLPRGYVHAALTTDVDSVHLTIGVLSTTWYDVLSTC